MGNDKNRRFHEILSAGRGYIVLLAVLIPVAAATGEVSDQSELMTASAALAIIQNQNDFPVIRESIQYEGMNPANNWERGVMTLNVVDSDALLPSGNYPVAPPRAGVFPATTIPYSVEKGLVNVNNRNDFGTFTAKQTALLTRNGFVVTPVNNLQMFEIYEQNVYWNLPNFITADVVMHTFSDLFGYLLRKVEKRHIYGWVKYLSAALREESTRQYASAKQPTVRAAAIRNAGYFAVAEAILKRTNRYIPEHIRNETEKEIERITRAAGSELCLLECKLDYTQFKPRGHYTRSTDYRNFFRVMMWYNQVFLAVPDNNQFSREILEAQLMVKALMDAKIRGIPARDVWTRVMNLTTLFSGPSNYLSVPQFQKIMTDIYGVSFSIDDLADEKKQREFIVRARQLPDSPIQKALAPDRQFRFFGKRFVLDTYIMQKLVKYPDRMFSSGLDVMAAMGNNRAGSLQKQSVTVPWYKKKINRVIGEVAATPEKTWTSSLYWGTLWSLSALEIDAKAGLPFFMAGQAWDDKTLNTACGSWAELRHNTILYAEDYSAEGDGDRYTVSFPKGYIEPNWLFFNRMKWLMDKTLADLMSSGCLTQRMKEKIDILKEICDRCVPIVEKELTGLPLTEDDYRFIHSVGSRFSQITTGCLLNDNYREAWDMKIQWYNLPEGSKSMAVIADVGTSQTDQKVHEVGIGRPREIFVIVPSTRGPRLTRGAVYQFYEFLQPIEKRLTDEEWWDMLNSSNPPEIPKWSGSYQNTEFKPGFYEYQNKFSPGLSAYKYIFEPD